MTAGCESRTSAATAASSNARAVVHDHHGPLSAILHAEELLDRCALGVAGAAGALNTNA
jgi:hypothetical protein